MKNKPEPSKCLMFHDWGRYEEPKYIICMDYNVLRLRALDEKWCQKRTCNRCGKVMWKRV